MGLFKRRPTPPRDERPWPQPGLVTIMSAETQEWVFVSAKAIRQHGGLTLLSVTGDQRWLSEAETEALRQELESLAASGVSPNDRLDIRRAAALTEYGLGTGTGVSVVPPA
jgi:hypothetical protein